jgi:hypothetical protein
MNVMLEFINDVTKDDMELNHKVIGIYRSIFENSATDINKKQVAAQPGTCQQGITPNDNFAGHGNMPSDETVARLMKQSYASRFGQWCGTVGSGRTSLGMWGGTGPENANDDTSTAQS